MFYGLLKVVRSGDLVSYCAEEGVRILGEGKFLLSDSFPGNERTKYCLTSKVILSNFSKVLMCCWHLVVICSIRDLVVLLIEPLQWPFLSWHEMSINSARPSDSYHRGIKIQRYIQRIIDQLLHYISRKPLKQCNIIGMSMSSVFITKKC